MMILASFVYIGFVGLCVSVLLFGIHALYHVLYQGEGQFSEKAMLWFLVIFMFAVMVVFGSYMISKDARADEPILLIEEDC